MNYAQMQPLILVGFTPTNLVHQLGLQQKYKVAIIGNCIHCSGTSQCCPDLTCSRQQKWRPHKLPHTQPFPADNAIHISAGQKQLGNKTGWFFKN